MIHTKIIYADWLEYCLLSAEDMTDRDEASQVAADSKYATYYGRSWDLVCSVREWEPDLFNAAEEEEPEYRNRDSSLTDMISWTAFVMTRMKLEHYMDAKEEE
jgi:hypothetical protein